MRHHPYRKPRRAPAANPEPAGSPIAPACRTSRHFVRKTLARFDCVSFYRATAPSGGCRVRQPVRTTPPLRDASCSAGLRVGVKDMSSSIQQCAHHALHIALRSRLTGTFSVMFYQGIWETCRAYKYMKQYCPTRRAARHDLKWLPHFPYTYSMRMSSESDHHAYLDSFVEQSFDIVPVHLPILVHIQT